MFTYAMYTNMLCTQICYVHLCYVHICYVHICYAHEEDRDINGMYHCYVFVVHLIHSNIILSTCKTGFYDNRIWTVFHPLEIKLLDFSPRAYIKGYARNLTFKEGILYKRHQLINNYFKLFRYWLFKGREYSQVQ